MVEFIASLGVFMVIAVIVFIVLLLFGKRAVVESI